MRPPSCLQEVIEPQKKLYNSSTNYKKWGEQNDYLTAAKSLTPAIFPTQPGGAFPTHRLSLDGSRPTTAQRSTPVGKLRRPEYGRMHIEDAPVKPIPPPSRPSTSRSRPATSRPRTASSSHTARSGRSGHETARSGRSGASRLSSRGRTPRSQAGSSRGETPRPESSRRGGSRGEYIETGFGESSQSLESTQAMEGLGRQPVHIRKDVERMRRSIATQNGKDHQLYAALVKEARGGPMLSQVGLHRVLEAFGSITQAAHFKFLLQAMGQPANEDINIDELLHFCHGKRLDMTKMHLTEASVNPLTASQKSSFWTFNDNLPSSCRKGTPKGDRKTPEKESGGQARTAAQLRRFILLKEKYEGASLEQVRPVIARRIYAKMMEIEEALEEVDTNGDGVVPVIELRNILDQYTIPVDDAVFHKLVRPFLLANDSGDALADSHCMLNVLLDVFIEEKERKGESLHQGGSQTARSHTGERLKHMMGTQTGVARSLLGSAQRARDKRKGPEGKRTPRFGSKKVGGQEGAKERCKPCVTTGGPAAGYQFVSPGW